MDTDTTASDDEVTDEVAARRAAVQSEMQARSVITTEDTVQVDYFGKVEDIVVPLPDGKSWMSHRVLMEGEKRDYLNKVNHGLVLNQATKDARLALKPGDDRYHLLKLSITGWHLIRGGVEVPFNSGTLEEVLKKFPPKVLDEVELSIRKHNPWLLDDVTIETLEREIAQLGELLETKKKEQEGNGGSSS